MRRRLTTFFIYEVEEHKGEVYTVPGGEVVVFSYTPRDWLQRVEGWVDLSALTEDDLIELCEMVGNARYASMQLTAMDDPLVRFREKVIPLGVEYRVVVRQLAGQTRRIVYHFEVRNAT